MPSHDRRQWHSGDSSTRPISAARGRRTESGAVWARFGKLLLRLWRQLRHLSALPGLPETIATDPPILRLSVAPAFGCVTRQ